MNKIKLTWILPIILLFFSCSIDVKNENESVKKWKKEIIATEEAFAKMVKDEGISKAFLAYAAEDAVLRRKTLVIGKQNIRKYFMGNPSPGQEESLIWNADFVEVSKSGDLAYTYGNYLYSFVDSSGTKVENKGIFHTIWKRQSDGSWKFVWD